MLLPVSQCAQEFVAEEYALRLLEFNLMVTMRAVNIEPVLFMFHIGLGSLCVPDKHLESFS